MLLPIDLPKHGSTDVSQVTQPILEMVNISKTFFGVKALSKVSLNILPGEVHALMGENGAGKSTLIKILSGAYRADPGATIRIDGVRVDIENPLVARKLGISVIYQELSLSPNLTAAENIFLGGEPQRLGFVDRQRMVEDSQAVLSRLDAPFSPSTRVADLSIAERQLVEIARALHGRSRIVVMDEPTTALSTHETEQLFRLVRQLRAEGLAIIYISHRMAEIYELADRVSVLRDGSHVGTLSRKDISASSLVRMMVGRDLSTFYKKEHAVAPRFGEVLLKVRGVGDDKRVFGCSFDLRAGEVLGLAGLVGAGRTELARLVFNADQRTTGDVELDGQLLQHRSPRDAISAGLVYLTEDRKRLGLFLDMSVRGNITLGVLAQDARLGFIDQARTRMRSAEAIRKMSIRVADDRAEVGGLSGGNQQKALLSRLLERSPKVLILDEPTRGIDIGAKVEIYRLIDELARAGMGIVVISSELPEIVGITDRVLVMREGRIAGEIAGTATHPITQEAIIAIATGASADRGGLREPSEHNSERVH